MRRFRICCLTAALAIAIFSAVAGSALADEAEVNGSNTDEEYIIPDSDTRIFAVEELDGMTAEQLRLARNEIYARHGRGFVDPDLQLYFSTRSWYQRLYEPGQYETDKLTNIEYTNVIAIVQYEEAHAGELQNMSSVHLAEGSEFVIPYSSERLLTKADVEWLTMDQLKIARNEIYARHGVIFRDSSLQVFFNARSWYTPQIRAEEFSNDMLNDVEKANVKFIYEYETGSPLPEQVPETTAPEPEVVTPITIEPITTEPEKEKDYIIEGSDSRYITDSDLRNLTQKELMLARNEIYARHGRAFQNNEIYSYFIQKRWYKANVPSERFDYSVLNIYEVSNIQRISEVESARHETN